VAGGVRLVAEEPAGLDTPVEEEPAGERRRGGGRRKLVGPTMGKMVISLSV
jgi:hypothetical protein